MTTNTAAVLPPARQDPRQVVNTLKRTVNWNDAGIASGVPFANSFPMGAVILGAVVEIVTAFDAGAVLTVGTVGASYNNLIASTDVDEQTVGVTGPIMRGAGRGLTAAADITPYYMVTGALTAGQAIITYMFEGGFDS